MDVGFEKKVLHGNVSIVRTVDLILSKGRASNSTFLCLLSLHANSKKHADSIYPKCVVFIS
ncbi:hypothetical protein PC1C4_16880 [Paraprevotella clara]|nr:hypothetical protein PC1C4_16880 [Paraprevotella clara]